MDRDAAIASILPTLESLPSKVLHLPAKDLASKTLSSAIAVKHARATLSRLKIDSMLPASARINFKIQGSKKIVKKQEFKDIQILTDEKVKEFQVFLKAQIIKAQEVEFDECIATFHRTFIHNSFLLSNNLVRFYKILFQSDSKIDEKLISQIALRNLFDEIYNFTPTKEIEKEANVNIHDVNEYTPQAAGAQLLRYLNVGSKMNLLLHMINLLLHHRRI